MPEFLHVPPGPLTVGSTIMICYGPDVSHANTTITVDIDNGDGTKKTLQIELDNLGYGCANWEVPDWVQASFQVGDQNPVEREIVEPGA